MPTRTERAPHTSGHTRSQKPRHLDVQLNLQSRIDDLSFHMRISYRHESDSGAVYTLEQRGELLHVHSRIPQLELRWKNDRWTPERNSFERSFVFPIEVGLDEFLARQLPHLNGCSIQAFIQGAQAEHKGYSTFSGKWFTFQSTGNMPSVHRAHKSLLKTTASYYGVTSLFG